MYTIAETILYEHTLIKGRDRVNTLGLPISIDIIIRHITNRSCY